MFTRIIFRVSYISLLSCVFVLLPYECVLAPDKIRISEPVNKFDLLGRTLRFPGDKQIF